MTTPTWRERAALRRTRLAASLLLALGASAAVATAAHAQTFAVDDPALKRIWALGMDSSQAASLAQALTDSIGPRLTGSPGHKAGVDWLVSTYTRYGITARAERYGTWRGWRRGTSHIDLVAPRVRSLEGTMLAWSPGTKGAAAVQGPAVMLPDLKDSAAFAAWLPKARGAYVLTSAPQATCRPDASWREWATPETVERMTAARTAANAAWTARVQRTGYNARTLPVALEKAGARGIVTSLWSNGWGVDKIFNARTEQVPTVDLSCEDYGLVARLAERNQGPVIRMQADAQFTGETPVFNAIAEIRGSEKPDEYVMLSAHFDSWDAASGATDNATGTVTMLEAMRILKQVYPKPKRTIVAGHWGGEEQGLNGSRAFAADHPEMVKGLQALFNQDNGTGRVSNISMQGLTGAGALFGGWMAKLPTEIARHITLQIPGSPGGGGSDYASFVCAGAPAFNLSSNSWDYGQYTWHTNRDTYDKIALDELRNNATLTAMLVYLASEDHVTTPRDRRVMPVDARTGQNVQWPACTAPARSSAESTR